MVTPDGSVAQPFQSWADATRVPTPERTTTIYPAKDLCPPTASGDGVRAACATQDGRIGIDAPFCSIDAQSCRLNLRHELGHLYDYSMPDWKRTAFLKIIGRVGTPWRTNDRNASPHEIFADAYSYVASYSTAARALRAANLDGFSDDGRLVTGRGFIIERRTFGRVTRLIRQPNSGAAVTVDAEHSDPVAEQKFLRRMKSKYHPKRTWVDGCNQFEEGRFDCSGGFVQKRQRCRTSGTVEWLADGLHVNVSAHNCRRVRR